MKWYTCCNARGLNLGGECLIAAVHSCLDNTSLIPTVVFYGGNNPLMSYFSSIGVNVLTIDPPMDDILRKNYTNKKIDLDWLLGASLRFHVPLLEFESDYILYTDTDVVFNSSFDFTAADVALAAAGELVMRDGSSQVSKEIFNAGVIFLNVKVFKHLYLEFREECVKISKGTIDNSWYDQGILNRFFKGLWVDMGQQYNHRPFHRLQGDAKITHYQFVKPNMLSKRFSFNDDQYIENLILEANRIVYDTERNKFKKYLDSESLKALRLSAPNALTSED